MSRLRPSGKAGIGVQGRKVLPGDDVTVIMGEAERKAKNTEQPSEFSHGRGLVPSGFEDARQIAVGVIARFRLRSRPKYRWARAAREDDSRRTERHPDMATKKQQAAHAKFARQARAKGKTKVGKAAASRTKRKRKH
jgi:hypothetical protein